jgi:hypothetical protein
MSFSVKYTGGSLVDWVRAGREPMQRTMRAVANAGAEELARRAAEHTPAETGNTAASWRTVPARPTRNGWEASAETSHPLAHLLEYGTDPHRLAPDDAQALDTPEGPRAGAEHPGSRAHHMMARAAAELEESLDAIAAPHLAAWEREADALAKRHRGIE